MKLGESEQLLREYNYCTTGVKSDSKEKSNYSLTITNKRIISSRNTRTGSYSTEIRTKDVKSVSCGIEIRRYWWILIFGLIAFVAATVLLCFKSIAVCFALGCSFGVVAVALILLFIFKKKKSFYLLFGVTEQYHPELQLFVSNYKLMLEQRGGKTEVVKVLVNDKVAKQMVDEIGALIVDCQAHQNPMM